MRASLRAAGSRALAAFRAPADALCASRPQVHALEEERELLHASLDQAAELRRQWEEAMQAAETEVLRERAEHAAALASLQSLAAASRADAATHLAARQQARAPRGDSRAPQRRMARANLAAAVCAPACAARRRIWPRAAADAASGGRGVATGGS